MLCSVLHGEVDDSIVVFIVDFTSNNLHVYHLNQFCIVCQLWCQTERLDFTYTKKSGARQIIFFSALKQLYIPMGGRILLVVSIPFHQWCKRGKKVEITACRKTQTW